MILSDYHVHTLFSDDSDTPVRDQLDALIQKGIRFICLTDHVDHDYPTGEYLLDADRYYPEIQKISEEYRDRASVRIGIELGLRPESYDKICRTAAQYPWDFIIGSTHLMGDEDPYYPEFWEDCRVSDVIHRYYEITLKNIRLFDCFDVYGHIDYISRYIPEGRQGEYHPEEFSDQIDEILKELISRGKGIECNTSGFRHSLGLPNPSPAIIKRYRELGGRILSVGSDAHKPELTALGFDKVPGLLSACGFETYTVFQNRKPTFLPL